MLSFGGRGNGYYYKGVLSLTVLILSPYNNCLLGELLLI